MSDAELQPARPHASGVRECTEDDLRRGRRLLLTEQAFAAALAATMGGVFLTALVTALEGTARELSWVFAAGYLGQVGMLITNPILNKYRSRRKLCLVDLGAVRVLRVVLSILPLLMYLGIARKSLILPIAACHLVSVFFGMSAEISRRSWIADLVPPSARGIFFSRRVIISSSMNVAVLYGGGKMLDWFMRSGIESLLANAIIIGWGALMGVVGWVLIYRCPEPPMAPPRRETGLMDSLAKSLVMPWTHPRFRPLILVALAWSFSVGFAADFFILYMRTHLAMDYAWIAAVCVSGELLSIFGAFFWGKWVDRWGARRVFTISMIVKAIFPALYILVQPSAWPLAFAVNACSVFNSAQMICWLRLSLNLSPSRNQAAFLAMHQAMMGLGQAIGTLSAGFLAGVLATVHLPTIGGFVIVPLHVLFAISMVLRMSTVPLLRFVREPRRIMAGLVE